MRIAVLCTDQGVRIPGTKGASLHLLAITRAFAQLGHEVLLLGVAGHGTVPRDVRTHLLPHPGRAEGLLREDNKLALTDQFVRECGPVLDDFAPDVIYERLALFGTAGLHLAARTGAHHVVEVNALLSREEATWRGLHRVAEARWRESSVLTEADTVVTVSRQWAAAVRHIRADRVITVPNGVDSSAFTGPVDEERVRREVGVGPHERLVVFTGTLRPWHGVGAAIDALPSLPEGVRLVVVGDGPETSSLRARADGLGVADRLTLTGWLPHARVAQLLRCADVGIAPYPDLPDFAFSPLKVFEYHAAGLPVVASDLGQLRELSATYDACVLVAPGSAPELAEGIARALTDDRVRDAARRARVRVLCECSWEARGRAILHAVAQRVRVGA